RGSVSKSTVKAWIEKLKLVESFLQTPANDLSLLRPDDSSVSCGDYDQLRPTELSDHCLSNMNSQFGPKVSLDRKLVIRMCGLMVPYSDHSMNDVATLTTSHLSALDKIQCSLNQLAVSTSEIKTRICPIVPSSRAHQGTSGASAHQKMDRSFANVAAGPTVPPSHCPTVSRPLVPPKPKTRTIRVKSANGTDIDTALKRSPCLETSFRAR